MFQISILISIVISWSQVNILTKSLSARFFWIIHSLIRICESKSLIIVLLLRYSEILIKNKSCKKRISGFLNDSEWFNICISHNNWDLLFKMRFIIKSSRSIKSYAFLFAEYTKKTYYNIRISIKINHMSVCNEDNKFKERRLYKREKGLYINRRTALNPIELSKP